MSASEIIWGGGAVAGKLKSLQIESAGHLPDKSYRMEWTARTWGVGFVWEGSGSYRADSSHVY